MLIENQMVVGAPLRIGLSRCGKPVLRHVLPVPDSTESRHDIIQAVTFGKPEGVIAFCQGIQAAAPVDSYVTPEPWAMPAASPPCVPQTPLSMR